MQRFAPTLIVAAAAIGAGAVKPQSAAHPFAAGDPAPWTIPTGQDVVTDRVDMRPVPPVTGNP